MHLPSEKDKINQVTIVFPSCCFLFVCVCVWCFFVLICLVLVFYFLEGTENDNDLKGKLEQIHKAARGQSQSAQGFKLPKPFQLTP